MDHSIFRRIDNQITYFHLVDKPVKLSRGDRHCSRLIVSIGAKQSTLKRRRDWAQAPIDLQERPIQEQSRFG